MLRKTPVFTATAVLTLALGIGVNTAIFSALNATILRPLPYKNPEQLVMVWGLEPRGCCRHGGMVFSSPNFLDFKDQNRVFERMAAFDGTGFTLTSVENPQKIHAGRVTADFFTVLQARPMLGRAFLPGENEPGRDHVVVLSYGIWQRRFGPNSNVVGQTIRLDANEYEVVGVMPHDFDFSIPNYYGPMDLWVPIVLTRDNSERKHNYLNVIARLNPGVTVRQAQAEANTIAARLRREYSSTTEQSNAPSTTTAETNEHSGVMLGTKLEPLRDEIFGDVRSLLLILFGAVGFVLFIACANVANLQLARASARQKEIALRTALGASRGRVARQLITESVLLALIGGVWSLLLVFWLIKLLTGLLPTVMPQGTSITIDANVLVYSLTVSLATGLLFGLAPIFQAFSRSPSESLKEGGKTTATGDGGLRLRGFLTVSEIALSMVLLIGAGLLTHTFVGLLNVKPGFESENILTAKVTLPKYSYADARQQADFYTRLLEAIGTLPGVRAAGAVNDLPLGAGRDSDEFTIERRGARDVSSSTGSCQDRLISPDYFRVMSIPLIKGRTFTKADASSAPPVVIISQSFARRFFPNPWSAHNICRPGSSSALADNCGSCGRRAGPRIGCRPRHRDLRALSTERLALQSAPVHEPCRQYCRRPEQSHLRGVGRNSRARQEPASPRGRANDRCLLGVNFSATLQYAFTQHFRWHCHNFGGYRNLRCNFVFGDATESRNWSSRGARRSSRRYIASHLGSRCEANGQWGEHWTRRCAPHHTSDEIAAFRSESDGPADIRGRGLLAHICRARGLLHSCAASDACRSDRGLAI